MKYVNWIFIKLLVFNINEIFNDFLLYMIIFCFFSYQLNILIWDIRNFFGLLLENSIRSEVEKMVVDKIEIKMIKLGFLLSVSIKEISIKGR